MKPPLSGKFSQGAPFLQSTIGDAQPPGSSLEVLPLRLDGDSDRRIGGHLADLLKSYSKSDCVRDGPFEVFVRPTAFQGAFGGTIVFRDVADANRARTYMTICDPLYELAKLPDVPRIGAA